MKVEGSKSRSIEREIARSTNESWLSVVINNMGD